MNFFTPHLWLPGVSGWTGPTSGLVSQWWLDNSHVSGTTITDSGPNNNTGTASSGVSSTSSPAGAFYSTARAFNGTSNAIIALASDPAATLNWDSGTYTLAMWVNLVDITALGSGGFRATMFSSLLNLSGGTGMRVLNNTNFGNGVVGFETQSTGGLRSTSAVLVNNTWAHIGFTYSNGTAVLYVNGSSVAATIGPNNDNVGSIGGSISGSAGNACINGSLYNIVFYNRVLSSGEMSTLFSAK